MSLRQKYNDMIPALREKCEIKNVMRTPRLEKVVVSVGVGKDGQDKKILQSVVDTISLITGQKAMVTKARKSIAGFKARAGMPSGVKVTLRGASMYNFLEKLISLHSQG